MKEEMSEIEKQEKINISVRSLVEFVLRQGDLGSSQLSPLRAEEGAKAHRQLQAVPGRYEKTELTLRHDFTLHGMTLAVSGRADGLFFDGDLPVIDEIKSTLRPAELVEENPVHLAQGIFYAYMYAVDQSLDKVSVQVTYYSLLDESLQSYRHDYDLNYLEDYVLSVAGQYARFMAFLAMLESQRNHSIHALDFPFNSYRPGQKKLVGDVYRAIRDKKRLFVKAPTGIGKTVSTLYPAIKSLVHHDNKRIFYLTAKGVNARAVTDTLSMMTRVGLSLRATFLTAKEKICPYGRCDMTTCQYAKGHYDRINQAIWDILENAMIMDRDCILKYAETHMVCPFEYSLDLALYSDLIVGDYNYAFDPSVYLRRFFDMEMGKYIFLMDEAHNFIDRAREMYSATLEKSSFMELRRQIKAYAESRRYIPMPIHQILKSLAGINTQFLKLRENNLESSVINLLPEKFSRAVYRFNEHCETLFTQEGELQSLPFYQPLMDNYFACYRYSLIAGLYSSAYMDSYRTLLYQKEREMVLRLYCLDPSGLIREALGRATATIAFSATLTPPSYYVDMIGGREDSVFLLLPSPFPEKNLRVIVDRGLSVRYIHRQAGLEGLADRIYGAIACKKGNYMVFFPSHEYMMQAYQCFVQRYPDIPTLIQGKVLNDRERAEFLGAFAPQQEDFLLGFAVLGGIFGEGIDLRGDRLSGSIIVSLGLPKGNVEMNLIRDYFDQKGHRGYDYSYRYSAMNKVMQAGGRVIRTEADRGFILLIDDRYLEEENLRLFPQEWNHYQTVSTLEQLQKNISAFWKGTDL